MYEKIKILRGIFYFTRCRENIDRSRSGQNDGKVNQSFWKRFGRKFKGI